MSRTVLIIAGIAIAAGAAHAQEQEKPVEAFDESVMTEEDRQNRTDTTGPQGEQATEPELREPYDTQAEERPTPLEDRYDPRGDASTYGADENGGAEVAGQQQPPTGVAPASTSELGGKTVVTAQGEEVGTIEQVGYSRQHGDRVATVDVGGFLGVGGKIIAIPISELGLGGEDAEVTTSMTRTSLEQAQEFDSSQLVTAE